MAAARTIFPSAQIAVVAQSGPSAWNTNLSSVEQLMSQVDAVTMHHYGPSANTILIQPPELQRPTILLDGESGGETLNHCNVVWSALPFLNGDSNVVSAPFSLSLSLSPFCSCCAVHTHTHTHTHTHSLTVSQSMANEIREVFSSKFPHLRLWRTE